MDLIMDVLFYCDKFPPGDFNAKDTCCSATWYFIISFSKDKKIIQVVYCLLFCEFEEVK